MDDGEWLAAHFERHRPHLRAVVCRMLGLKQGRRRDALFAARGGDFDALIAVLHPGVVARADFGARPPAGTVVTHGADAVARQALLGAALPTARLHPALVNGSPGAVITLRGQPFAVMSFVVADGKIAEIDTMADPERVPRIAAAVLAK
jgi:hypothetical protein